MTASISSPPGTPGASPRDRFAGFGPLFRKELREWATASAPWVILVVTTAVHDPDRRQRGDQHLDHRQRPGRDGLRRARSPSIRSSNFLAAVASQIFVIVAIFAAMSLLVAERERGTLAWVASKPVSRGAIWLSKWAAAAIVVSIVAGLIPMAATFGVVAVLYGSAGVGAVRRSRRSGSRASVAFIVAVVLAASTVISNQAAVAAIGFAVFFLPQILVALSRSTSRRSCRPRSWAGRSASPPAPTSGS